MQGTRFHRSFLTFILTSSLTFLLIGQEIQVLPEAVEVEFPAGFDIVDNQGNLLESKPDARSARIQAFLERDGTRLFISDWSLQRLRDLNEPPNWIIPRTSPENPNAMATNGEPINRINGLIEQAYRAADSGENQKALQLLRDGITYAKANLSQKSIDEAYAFYDLASAAKSLEAFQDAVFLYEEALGSFAELNEVSVTDIALIKSNFAGVLEKLERFEEAGQHYLEALETLEIHLGENSIEVGTVLNNLGGLYSEIPGNEVQAFMSYQRAWTIHVEIYGDDHPRSRELFGKNLNASFYALLASTDEALLDHRFADAKSLLDRFFDIQIDLERWVVDDSPIRPKIYRRSAEVFRALGMPHQGATQIANAFELAQNSLATDDPERIEILRLVGVYTFLTENNMPKAMEHIEIARGAARRSGNREAECRVVSEIGSLFLYNGEYEQSIKALEDALMLAETANLSDNAKITLLNNLAAAEGRNMNFARAIELYERAISEYGDSQTVSADNLLTIKLNLVQSLRASENSSGALELAEEIIPLLKSRHSQILASLEPRDSVRYKLYAYQQLSSLYRIPELSGKAQFYFKGIVDETSLEISKNRSFLSKTESGRLLLEEHDNLRKQKVDALLRNEAPEALLEIDQAVGKLERKAKAALGNLSVDSPNFEELRGLLKGNAVLVEAVRVESIGDGSDPSGYAVSLTSSAPENDSFFFVHSDLDNEIAHFRDLIAKEMKGEDVDSPEFRSVEQRIWEQFHSRIIDKVPAGSEIILALDGDLLLLPVEMLRGPEGKLFCEQFSIRRSLSGRSLFKQSPTKTTGNHALIVANPVFGDQDIRPAFIRLNRLPGTALESEKIHSLLSSGGYETSRLFGSSATEPNLSAKIEGQNIVHFATHGLYKEISKDTSNEPDDFPVEPSLRSMIALTGAQDSFERWEIGEYPPANEDGILMAHEVGLLNLSDCKLVVLSTCESALGYGIPSEGFAGIKRALLTAGASNVVGTLWEIDDAATVLFMETFYGKLLDGAPPSAALSETQCLLYRKWSDEFGELEAICLVAPFVCTN